MADGCAVGDRVDELLARHWADVVALAELVRDVLPIDVAPDAATAAARIFAEARGETSTGTTKPSETDKTASAGEGAAVEAVVGADGGADSEAADVDPVVAPGDVEPEVAGLPASGGGTGGAGGSEGGDGAAGDAILGPEMGPLPAVKRDELFLLRYVLSFETAAKAEEQLRKGIAWRAVPENQAFIAPADLGYTAFQETELAMLFRGYYCSGWLENAQRFGGPTVLVRGALSNMVGGPTAFTPQEQMSGQLTGREMAYRACDYIQRRHGVMAKLVMMLDMQDVALSAMGGGRGSPEQKMRSKMQEISGYVFPQLLERFCMVNAPGWMTTMVALFRRLTPAKVMARFYLFGTPEELWETEWAQTALIRANLPTNVGGSRSLDTLQGGLSGEDVLPFDNDTEITVSARSSRDVTVKIPIGGCHVAYTVMLASYGIGFSARLVHGGLGPEECSIPTGEVTVLREGKDDKVKAENGPVRGEWVCKSPGMLVVTFNNSYSVLRSKTIKYNFVVDSAVAGTPATEATSKAE